MGRGRDPADGHLERAVGSGDGDALLLVCRCSVVFPTCDDVEAPGPYEVARSIEFLDPVVLAIGDVDVFGCVVDGDASGAIEGPAGRSARAEGAQPFDFGGGRGGEVREGGQRDYGGPG